jgi:DNA invertase Pin-like site-specific DNA recombinase
VVEVFTDKSSGSGALDFNTRPGLRAMLGRVAVGGIDQVVTETLDRIARKHAEASAVLKFFKRTGARLVTLSNAGARDIAATISALLGAAGGHDRITKVRRGKRAPSGSALAKQLV